MRVFFNALIMLFILFGFARGSVAGTTEYLHRIQNDPVALYSFFKAMPKGGDLHYHFAGGVYPEAMIELAAKYGYCYETGSWWIHRDKGVCHGVTSSSLLQHAALYRQVVHAWSLQDFDGHAGETAHDHFFETFGKFKDIYNGHYPELLIDIIERAANQHIAYLEILMIPDNALLDQLPKSAEPFKVDDIERRRTQLLADPHFQLMVTQAVQQINQDWQDTRQRLGCVKHPEADVCRVTVRFQQYSLREQSLDKVVDQALWSFLVVQQTSMVVGVNLVQAEDGLIALRDYHSQMKVFEFLHQHYPKVSISLHAGELAFQSVAPKHLRYHIDDAIETGHAQRIGHGVDLPFEDNALQIMRTMKSQGIAVEVNLVSNAALLKVKGKQHPLNEYLKYGVPVVLSSDDEGILRTDLTSQYVEAVLHHGLDYPAIKTMNRNSLTYSFLPGKSLWADPVAAIRVPECTDLNSIACDTFVKKSEKAKLQRVLELDLLRFETF